MVTLDQGLGAGAALAAKAFITTSKKVPDGTVRAAVENAVTAFPDDWTKRYIIDSALGKLMQKGGTSYKDLAATADGVKALADIPAAAVAKEAAQINNIVDSALGNLGKSPKP